MLLAPTEQREGDCTGQQPNQKNKAPDGDIFEAGQGNAAPMHQAKECDGADGDSTGRKGQRFEVTQCDSHHHKGSAPNHCDEGNAKPVDHSGRCHGRTFTQAKEKGPASRAEPSKSNVSHSSPQD